MRKSLISTFIFAAILLIIACKQNNHSSDFKLAENEKEIIGKWVSVHDNGVMELNENHTFVTSGPYGHMFTVDTVSKGTWKFEDKILSLKPDTGKVINGLVHMDSTYIFWGNIDEMYEILKKEGKLQDMTKKDFLRRYGYVKH